MKNEKIKFSIEIAAKQVLDGKLTKELYPQGIRVYMTDIGTDTTDTMVNAAKTINEMGFKCVPHIAARRLESEEMLKERLEKFHKVGVDDLLFIAGEAEKQMGPYDQSLKVLKSGIVEEIGFKYVGVAGHPEGNEAYGGNNVMGTLKEKYELAKQAKFEMRIVTQFGFDGELFVEWAKEVKENGIDMPIHLGVAGPAKITTLLKYAAMCGVGNSMQFFKKRTRAIAHLTTGHSPEEVVKPIENAWRENKYNIEQLHIFPFGGLKSTSEWINNR